MKKKRVKFTALQFQSFFEKYKIYELNDFVWALIAKYKHSDNAARYAINKAKKLNWIEQFIGKDGRKYIQAGKNINIEKME